VLKGLAEEPERTFSITGGSLSDLLKHLRRAEGNLLKGRFFMEGDIRPDILVFINNVDASLLGGTDAKLKNGDEVTFLPSVHGG